MSIIETKRLLICTNCEWLRVFSGVEFDDIPDCDEYDAASDYISRLWTQLENAGFDCDSADGQRSTCHGWNGDQYLTHKIGPVGTFADLTPDEIETIEDCMETIEPDWLGEWKGDEPNAKYKITATYDNHGTRCVCNPDYAMGQYARQEFSTIEEAEAAADDLRDDVGDVVDTSVKYEVTETTN